MKKILILGGSYFTGRIFCMYAAREKLADITVINRGRYKLNLPNVRELVCDRHSAALGSMIGDEKFDAAIDFCAYSKNDISSVLEAFPGKIGHYIYFSTASVCRPEKGYLDENAAVWYNTPEGETGDYIRGKILLEEEIKEACGKNGIPFTIFRPSFIYGPFNYAPRESELIREIAQKGRLTLPTDSDSRMSFVYVTDVAVAAMRAAGNCVAYGETFNLAAPETVDYKTLYDVLRKVGGVFDVSGMTEKEIAGRGIVMPFPLTGDFLYDGRKASEKLGFEYSGLIRGMGLTFNAFYPLFAKK